MDIFELWSFLYCNWSIRNEYIDFVLFLFYFSYKENSFISETNFITTAYIKEKNFTSFNMDKFWFVKKLTVKNSPNWKDDFKPIF